MVCVTALALTAGRAEALSVRDVIELSKAGLSEPVLLALIDVERSVFSIDTATLKQLKEAGVTDGVIVAMIRSGRQAPPDFDPATAPQPAPEAQPMPEPQVVVIDHHDAPPPQPIYYPVAVPVYVPVATGVFDTGNHRGHSSNSNVVRATLATDQGIVKANLPLPANCVKADPVFWGWGGKLRPGSYEPPPTVVCR
jgi:hypothetical protein